MKQELKGNLLSPLPIALVGAMAAESSSRMPTPSASQMVSST